MATWDDGQRCYGVRIPGTDRCVAHSTERLRGNFWAALEPDSAALWDGQYLTNLRIDAQLHDEIVRVLARSPRSVRFDYSTFLSDVAFPETFLNASFRNVAFHGAANFGQATFRGPASFADAQFGTGGQSFSGATFEELLDLSCSPRAPHDVRELRNLHLSAATLSRGAVFDHRRFVANVFLDDARIGGPLLFAGVACAGEVSLDRLAVEEATTIWLPAGAHVSLDELVLTKSLTLTAAAPPADEQGQPVHLDSLRHATLSATLTVGQGVVLTDCRLIASVGLENMRFAVADPRWRTWRRRRIVRDELFVRGGGDDRVEAAAVEVVYRQLRTALESSRAAPAAADFYYGEMEMRRLAAGRGSFDRSLLAVYKVVAGYGLRASRPLLAYVMVLLAVTVALRYATDVFVADPVAAADSTGLSFSRFWDVFAIVARSSVSLLSAVTKGLTAAGTILFIVLRLTGPAALALAIFALRARVQR